jgi:hypothetical protein
MEYELKTKNAYKTVYNSIVNAEDNSSGAYQVAYQFCMTFEAPEYRNKKHGQYDANGNSVTNGGYDYFSSYKQLQKCIAARIGYTESQYRGNVASNSYWPKYGGSVQESSYTINSSYNGFTPIHAYAVNTGNISVYSDPEGSVESNRFITGSTDECIIDVIYTNGWCKVSYPSTVSPSGYHTAFVPLTEFISNASLSNWTSDADYTAYRRSSGSEKIGSISKGDVCLKVSSGNGRTQVIYPVTGKGYYKMGWIGASEDSNGTSNATVSNSYKTPCNTYAISTGNITVYDAVNGSVEQNRYITGSTDVCTIEEIYTNGWCKVTYPSTASSTGYRYAFTPLSEFITNASPVAWTATEKYDAYRRSSGSEKIGSISSGDQCIKVSEANGRMQVMYPVTGTGYYKMGWIDKTGGNDPTYAIDNCSGGLYSLSVADGLLTLMIQGHS